MVKFNECVEKMDKADRRLELTKAKNEADQLSDYFPQSAR